MPPNSDDTQNPLGPERLPTEPLRAFRAFCYYRDQGPGRSIDKAWREYCEKEGKGTSHRAPGKWTDWSAEWSWRERAAAWDDAADAVKRAEYLQRVKELEAKRVEEEFTYQDKASKLVKLWTEALEKAALAPVTDVTQQKIVDGRPLVTKVKGINFSACARMLLAQIQQARVAVRGLPPGWDKPKDDDAGETESEEVGVVWMEATTSNGEKK